MAITTYAELKSAVSDWLAKSNLSARSADFIMLAEKRLLRRLRILGLEATQSGNLVSGSRELALPTNYREAKAFYIDANPIEPLKPVTADAFFATRHSYESATPRIFTVIGSNFLLGPTPDSDYAYVLHYLSKVDPLSDVNTQNWLLSNHPDLYLYASLLEAEPFLKNDARILVWRGYLEDALQYVGVEDEYSRYSGGPLEPRAS